MNQAPPEGDARYRVHRSTKCYVGEYHGSQPGIGTWYFQDSAERVVYKFSDGSERIQYKNRFYRLHPPEDLIALAEEHWSLGGQGPVVVGGKGIYASQQNRSFDPHPFIVAYYEPGE